MVLVSLVLVFRDWRLCALALLPTFAGLVWTAGLLALAGVELDLFAVFAVVTFVGIGVDYGIHMVHRYRERRDPVADGLGARAGHPGGRRHHVVRLRHAHHIFVSAAAIHRHRLGRQRVRARAGVGHSASGADDEEAGMTMNVAALIPAYNEAATIADVVRGVQPFVSRVLVVDDGSSDGPADEARAAGADVVAHAGNLGQGTRGAHRARASSERRYTHVLLLDGDMQHLPQEAPRLLDAARATGADVVIGERQFDPAGMPASRYHANRIGSRALSCFVGVPVDDTQCGFRDISRRGCFAGCGCLRAATTSRPKC